MFPRWLALTILLGAGSALAEPLPLEYFVKDGDYLDVKLSPSGNRMAARVRYEESAVLLVLDRETKKPVGGARPQAGDSIFDYHWINDERIVFSYAEDFGRFDSATATGELYSMNFDGRDQELLAGYRAGDSSIGTRLKTKESDKASFYLLDPMEDDDKHIMVLERPWSQQGRLLVDDGNKLPIINRLNAKTGRKRKIEVLPFHNAQPLTSRDGVVRFVSYQKEDGYWTAAYRANPGDEWTDLAEVLNLTGDTVALFLNEAGDAVYLRDYYGPERYRNIFRYDLKAQQMTPVFTDLDADIDQGNLYIDPNTGEVVAAKSMRGKPRYHYADGESEAAKLHKMLVRAFKGKSVDIVSSTKDGTEHMVRVSSDVNPGEYYIFNSETKSADFFWANMSWIDPRLLQPMLVDEVTTEDGMKIPVRLTLPEGDGPHPLIINPHGGPHGPRDDWGFNTEAQLLASQGYAVLQVNFRGSGGFGFKFTTAGHREWGGAMIDDMIAATRWAASHARVDGDRVCAYGASYGGYAAYMLAARAPELFKCTIGYVGVYDLEMMTSSGDIPRAWGGRAYLQRVLGNDTAQLREFSPVNHADKITANTMLIHGKQDRRAPIEHSEAMRKALREAGHNPEWLVFNQSGHGVGSEENRMELYQALLAFLDKNLN